MTNNSAPLICDECGKEITVGCILPTPHHWSTETAAAISAVIVAAHKRFHEEDRALADAQREGARRMIEVGPITSALVTRRNETIEEHECCARCGSSAGWVDCWSCVDGQVEVDDDDVMCSWEACHECGGRGGWECCLSSAEWCQANPLPGREAVERGSVETYSVPTTRTVLRCTDAPRDE